MHIEIYDPSQGFLAGKISNGLRMSKVRTENRFREGITNAAGCFAACRIRFIWVSNGTVGPVIGVLGLPCFSF